jgi:hypothetical protein
MASELPQRRATRRFKRSYDTFLATGCHQSTVIAEARRVSNIVEATKRLLGSLCLHIEQHHR